MKRINWGGILLVVIVIVAVLFFTGILKMPMSVEYMEPEVPATTEAPTAAPMAMAEMAMPEISDKVLAADELLPKLSEEADDFVKQNPVAKMLKEQNFLVSGYHVGINTVLQSHKIPYHDLRSSPAISKTTVSPWLNSSIEAPAGSSTRRLFEIGSA